MTFLASALGARPRGRFGVGANLCTRPIASVAAGNHHPPMHRFFGTTISAAVIMLVAMLLSFRRPEGVEDSEMLRRYAMIAAIVAGASVACGLIAVAGERVQRWAERKKDPLRRLD